MISIEIPDNLAPIWDRIVEELYHGDSDKAALDAISEFVKHTKKRLSAGKQFDIAFGEISERQKKKDELLEQGINQALKRMEDLKKRGFPPIKDKK